MFRRNRKCYLCKEESDSQSITRPQPPASLLLIEALERNTKAREALTEEMRKVRELTDLITPYPVPSYIETSGGIRMNLPEQIESD